jgi:hypothetical protein
VSRKTEKEQKRPEWKPRSDYAVGCGCHDNSELLRQIDNELMWGDTTKVTEDFRDDGQGLSTLMRCAPDGDVHGE